MKNLIFISALTLGGLFYQKAAAQVDFRVNVNLGKGSGIIRSAPVYGGEDYYYLPDVEAYYSAHQNRYYYKDGVNWIGSANLPGRFHNYDWQHARRFAVTEPRPFLHDDVYRTRYGGVGERRDLSYRDEHNNREFPEGVISTTSEGKIISITAIK